MSVVLLLVHLLASDAQLRAVRDHNVVTAVGRRVPDRLVLAAENGSYPRRQAAKRRRLEERRIDGRKRFNGGEGVMGSRG